MGSQDLSARARCRYWHRGADAGPDRSAGVLDAPLPRGGRRVRSR